MLVRLGQEVQALPRRLTRLVLLLLLGLAGFVVLAVGYDREPLASVDADVAEWVSSSLPGLSRHSRDRSRGSAAGSE